MDLENGRSLAAAALLDSGTRTIRSFVGSELLNLPAALDDYDLIAAPGWNEPWSRAIRAGILDSDFMTVKVQAGEVSFIPRDEIQAIRVLTDNDPTIA